MHCGECTVLNLRVPFCSLLDPGFGCLMPDSWPNMDIYIENIAISKYPSCVVTYGFSATLLVPYLSSLSLPIQVPLPPPGGQSSISHSLNVYLLDIWLLCHLLVSPFICSLSLFSLTCVLTCTHMLNAHPRLWKITCVTYGSFATSYFPRLSTLFLFCVHIIAGVAT